MADIDFVTKAPDGKEVEELTKKEIHKALRSRISGEQAKLELSKEQERAGGEQIRPHPFRPRPYQPLPTFRRQQISNEEKNLFRTMLEELIGTRGAEILDSKLSVLGKVPISEIQTALKSVNNAHAVVMDGSIEREIVKTAEECNVKFVIGMDSKVRQNETKVNLVTVSELN